MAQGTKASQVKNGLRLAGLIILSFLIACFFFGGIAMVCFPQSVDRTSFWGSHSSLAGPIFLCFSSVVMFVTIDRWMKILVGFLALAVVNGLITLVSGHLLGNATQPVSRMDALYFTVFFAAATILAWQLGKRTLTALDRLLVMAFLFGVGCLLGYEGLRDISRIAPLGGVDFSFMAACLFFLFMRGCSIGFDNGTRSNGQVEGDVNNCRQGFCPRCAQAIARTIQAGASATCIQAQIKYPHLNTRLTVLGEANGKEKVRKLN
jgi:hypothetical protein